MTEHRRFAILSGLALILISPGCRRAAEAPAPEPARAPTVAPAPPEAADVPAAETAETGCPVPAPDGLLRVERTAGGIVLDPDPGYGTAAEVWRGDLNGDAIEDLLVRFPEACGGWGECPYAALAACAGDAYAWVLEADYAVGLEVAADGSTGGWRDLLRSERTDGAAGTVRALRFDGSRYAADD